MPVNYIAIAPVCRKLFLLLACACAIPAVFSAINFDITTASVYQSSSTTIGSGTAVCTNIDVVTADTSCGTAISPGATYRFEFVAENKRKNQH